MYIHMIEFVYLIEDMNKMGRPYNRGEGLFPVNVLFFVALVTNMKAFHDPFVRMNLKWMSYLVMISQDLYIYGTKSMSEYITKNIHVDSIKCQFG